MQKILLPLYVLATSAALIIIKLSTANGAPIYYLNNKLHFNINLLTILGLVLYVVSFLTYLLLISKFELGYIIPLTTGLVYILIFTASYFIFKEVFSVPKILGITLIIAGILLLNLKK
ncbi:MAG: hypothetical protein U0516_00380 [Candidatus Saccharibacteria bacterium]